MEHGMTRKQIEQYKERYKPGTRLLPMNMNDPYAPVPSGTKGTVTLVDDQAQIHMKWDNGRTLALIPGEDSFRTLTEKEVAEEQDALEDNSHIIEM